MRRLAILGASGHGKVVADTAECCGWTSVDFFDDAWPGMLVNGPWSVVGNTADLLNCCNEYEGVVIAIGNNTIRNAKLSALREVGAKLTLLVHPSATISQYASVGVGSVVFAGAVVNAGASVGPGAILNTSCSVDHDCVLGDAVHVSPGARLAGGVIVGDMTWVGIGASVKQMVRLGCRVTVGAGAAVVADVPDGITVVGVPAHPLKY